MFANNVSPLSVPTSDPSFSSPENGTSTNKRKRRPAGTPDPDAEVVSLSPKTLLESDRYVCEICNQGFQRDQNLQMHRRRHKVPWKLLKRETPMVKKRVFVCPEPNCLHHQPCHALGDLVGIKKHFRRKHSNYKQWVCERCSKGYAVQSDYKAHLKTCGTRGHSCDCGRVFSRVESFIEHQDVCNMGRQPHQPLQQLQQLPACLSRTASSPSPSSETNFSTCPNWPQGLVVMQKPTNEPTFFNMNPTSSTIAINDETSLSKKNHNLHPNLDLQLSTKNNSNTYTFDVVAASLNNNNNSLPKETSSEKQGMALLSVAMAEKVYAEEARKQAKKQIELAEQEFTNAKRIRQQAQVELEKAYALKENAMKQINSIMVQITCHACKQKFQARTTTSTTFDHENNSSLGLSYVSSAITIEGDEVENKNGKDHWKSNN
ncbi:putative chromatin regulator PHD family [Lupinus albus]|uniref:Putative chromatin regulator PHD family n=1 Tax=Lupinus albus TaxID=3870 RepID=A0A6A4NBN1_LUPAL|nr:putative chromatin regulator PHD family [Lupinus albus]